MTDEFYTIIYAPAYGDDARYEVRTTSSSNEAEATIERLENDGYERWEGSLPRGRNSYVVHRSKVVPVQVEKKVTRVKLGNEGVFS